MLATAWPCHLDASFWADLGDLTLCSYKAPNAAISIPCHPWPMCCVVRSVCFPATSVPCSLDQESYEMWFRKASADALTWVHKADWIPGLRPTGLKVLRRKSLLIALRGLHRLKWKVSLLIGQGVLVLPTIVACPSLWSGFHAFKPACTALKSDSPTIVRSPRYLGRVA